MPGYDQRNDVRRALLCAFVWCLYLFVNERIKRMLSRLNFLCFLTNASLLFNRRRSAYITSHFITKEGRAWGRISFSFFFL